MPLLSSYEMTRRAAAEGYAVAALNAENLEMVQAIISAAEELKAPVMIQTTPSTVKYLTLEEGYAMVEAMARTASVPVALHLDHCEKFDDCMKALRVGYTSVMIDGSKLPYEENVEITKKVVAAAHPMGVAVEAELGTVGGKEDGHSAEVQYTEPDMAVDFAERTGIDLFAVAIGTAHGFYKGVPKLNFDILTEVAHRIDVPLVLHGGSGLSDDTIRKTIELGIRKVNFATELRAAATAAVREALKDEKIIDPKKFMGPAREAVKELAKAKIMLTGSAGKY